MKEDQRDLIGESLDIRRGRNMLSGHIPHNGLFASKLSLILSEIRFIEQKFPISILVFDIKYNHSRL